VDTAATAPASQSPSGPAERPALAVEPTPRRLARGEQRAALKPVERLIVGFRRDEHEEWLAELSCGHTQHVRHRPPLCDVEAGGETACSAHLVCPECGAVLDGSRHVPGCSRSADS
jgi:hypothetical protein